MKNIRRAPAWAWVLIVILLLPLRSGAADETRVPLDPAVRMGRLPNGLTYYIRKNTKPEKHVELRLAVNTGSVQEDDDQLGLAHFVEHMCFRGTKSFPKAELLHYLQSVGSSFGPDVNAYTTFDETVYMLSLPSDSPQILGNGLKIMREWAHDVNFDDADIDRERGVVVEEWRIGRGANQRMMDKYIPVAFKGSKYATRIPIGTRESIEGSSHEAIKRFYRDWYRPDLMALVVVGDIEPDQIEKTVQSEFGSIPAPTSPRPHATPTVPENSDPLYSIVSDKENPYNVLMLAFKTPVETYHTGAEYRRYLTEHLYIQLLNTRLTELMQQATPPFVFANVNYSRMAVRATNAYMAAIVVPDGGVDRGLATLMTENERVRQFGFTAEELERGKRTLLKSIEDRYNEREKTESSKWVNEYVGHFLRDEPAPGVAFEYQFAKKHLGEITLADVNRLAQEWITPKNRILISENVEKPGVSLPTETELKGVIQTAAATKIQPHQEKRLASSLLKSSPRAGKIVSEKNIADAGLTELTLSNGVRVVLKPSDFKNDEIVFSAYRPGGQSLFPDDYNLSAELAAGYAGEAGVADFSKIDLQKMLAGKTISVTPQITTFFDGLKGNCSTADLRTALELTYLYFTKPRRDQTAYDSFVSRQRTMLQNLLSNPLYSFINEAQDRRYHHHPRNPNVLPTEKDWTTVSLDKVLQVYQGRFANAADYTFVIVGAFKIDEMKPLLETYLGSLPSTSTHAAWRDFGLRSEAGPVNEEIMRGTDPKSLMLVSADVPAKWSRDEGHIYWSLGNILQRRLIDALRVEMGGIYYVQVKASLENVPYEHATMDVIVPCSPENVDKLMAAIDHNVQDLQISGPAAEDLQKEMEAQRRSYQKEARDNNAWLWKLEMIYKFGEPMSRVTNPEELVQLVTKENIQRVAKQYLDTSKWIRFTMYPETK